MNPVKIVYSIPDHAVTQVNKKSTAIDDPIRRIPKRCHKILHWLKADYRSFWRSAGRAFPQVTIFKR